MHFDLEARQRPNNEPWKHLPKRNCLFWHYPISVEYSRAMWQPAPGVQGQTVITTQTSTMSKNSLRSNSALTATNAKAGMCVIDDQVSG